MWKTRGTNTSLNNEEKMTLGISKSFTINVEQLSVAPEQSSNGIYKDFNLDALSKLLAVQKAGNCSDKRYALISLKVNKLLQWR